MAKQPNKTKSGTNIQDVKQNIAQAQSGQGQSGQFGTEFASETDAQEVRKQNQQSEANKNKNK